MANKALFEPLTNLHEKIGEHMKKILKAIALITCLLFPLSAMAMSTIADNELSAVTGQSGVSINLDVSMDLSAATLAWGDADGSSFAANIGGTAANAGWVGLSNLQASGIRVQLRTDLINGALQGAGAGADLTAAVHAYIIANGGLYPGMTDPTNPATWDNGVIASSTGGTTLLAHASTDLPLIVAGQADSAAIAPLTIDVATNGTYGAATTYVHIGLGSLEISMQSLTADVKVGHTNALEGGTIGSIYMGGLDVFVSSASFVDIYKGSGTQGVVLNLGVVVDKLNITSMAWGDADGIGGSSTQGWVGLKNVAITNLTVTGPIAIDVATNAGKTYVNIGLGSVAIGLGGVDATVALGNAGNNLNQELGSIYISSLTATITGSVQISAHSATQGVVLDLNLGIAVTPFTFAWGDSDGMGAGTTAGYVGLKALTITGLTLVGEVTIDVATVNTSAALVTDATTLMYSAYNTHQMGLSFVHIGLGSGDPTDASKRLVVNIGTLAADVVLAADKTLTTTAGTLGSIYGAGIRASMNGWVDIAAH
jgi:hypothetical protein